MIIGIDARLWSEGGVGRYIRNLIKQLQILDRKNEYILFMRSEDRQKFEIRNSKFEIKIADIRWHSIEEQLRFVNVLNRENLDLMHFPYISVPIFYNKPFVVTIHDLIPFHFSTGEASTLSLSLYKLKFLGYKFILSAAAKKAKKIITVSNATKKEIADHLKVSEDKVRVTYEGIDDKITNPKSQIPNKLQNTKYKILNTKYFLYVGNAFPHKNLERLLEAFNILISQYPNILLVFVGKEDFFYKRLKSEVYKRRISNIVFLHNITDEQLGSLYKSALALVSPSFMEGFGLPALEAMANNCLVLASDIPAHREICENEAIYFNTHNE